MFCEHSTSLSPQCFFFLYSQSHINDFKRKKIKWEKEKMLNIDFQRKGNAACDTFRMV